MFNILPSIGLIFSNESAQLKLIFFLFEIIQLPYGHYIKLIKLKIKLQIKQAQILKPSSTVSLEMPIYEVLK